MSNAIKTFFNRPTDQRCKHAAHDWLLSDIRRAERHAIIAAAWFTDKVIADALIESNAKIRRAIFNRSDLNRENAPDIYTMLQLRGVEVGILGTGDWKEGVMHHKFIVADDVVWTGSYNFTYQAQRNFENMIRIDSADIAKDYLREANAIWADADTDEKNEPGYLDASGKFQRTNSWTDAWEEVRAMNKIRTAEGWRVARGVAAESLAEIVAGEKEPLRKLPERG